MSRTNRPGEDHSSETRIRLLLSELECEILDRKWTHRFHRHSICVADNHVVGGRESINSSVKIGLLITDGHKHCPVAFRLTIAVEGPLVKSLSSSVAVLIRYSSSVVFLSFVAAHQGHKMAHVDNPPQYDVGDPRVPSPCGCRFFCHSDRCRALHAYTADFEGGSSGL